MIQNKISVRERLSWRVCETDRFKAGFLSFLRQLFACQDFAQPSVIPFETY